MMMNRIWPRRWRSKREDQMNKNESKAKRCVVVIRVQSVRVTGGQSGLSQERHAVSPSLRYPQHPQASRCNVESSKLASCFSAACPGIPRPDGASQAR